MWCWQLAIRMRSGKPSRWVLSARSDAIIWGSANLKILSRRMPRFTPGNSGGALVDIEGHLLGINTAIYSSLSNGGSLGIGFAIPVSTVRAVFESIIATGTVTRGWIGIQPQEL